MTSNQTSNLASSVFRVGAHVSAAGGIHKAVERASGIGCNAVQVFSASPRTWRRSDLEKIVTPEINPAQKQLNVTPIVTHAMYLVNLASENPEQLAKSRSVLEFDLQFDAKIGGAGVVVHLGSHLGRGWDAVKDQVAEQITMILDATEAESPESHFLIENSAGQNGKLSSDLAEIRWLLDTIKNPRLGWCMDTCHAFAAGYSLGEKVGETTAENLQKNSQINNKTMVEAISEHNLWNDLRVIHVNDSKDPFGSGRDRHANIGEGNIPAEDFSYFLGEAVKHLQKTDAKKQIPLILEVPGQDDLGPDAINVQRVLDIVNQIK